MKERKLKIVGWLLVLILLFGSVITLLMASESVYDQKDDWTEDINLYDMVRINDVLYWRAKQYQGQYVKSPAEVFYDSVASNSDFFLCYAWNEDIYHYDNRLTYREEINYLVYDNQKNYTVATKETKAGLITKYFTQLISNSGNVAEVSKQFKELYGYYAVIQYDSQGNPAVIDCYGRKKQEIEVVLEDYRNIYASYEVPVYEPVEMDKSHIVTDSEDENVVYINGTRYKRNGYLSDNTGYYEDFYSLETNKTYQEMIYKVSYIATPNPIKDMTIVVAISDKNMAFYDYGPFYMDDYYGHVGFIYLLAGFMLIIAIAAIIASLVRPLGIADSFAAKLPFELITALGALVVLIAPSMEVLTKFYTKGLIFQNFLEANIPEKLARTMDGGLIYGSWILYFGVVFFGIVSLLTVFRKGLRRYLKENCWIIAGLLWCGRGIKRGIIKIVTFNYTGPINRFVCKIVGINFLLIAIMCSIWYFGIPVLIIYSIIIFYYLQKYISSLKNNYDQVLMATHNMAEGNLECSINENLGLFTPIAKELNKVQYGFKRAVTEEVKSQNMKTELITNVSHDLKTPLTAIITYINLLKEDNLTEEQRKEYIETLDNKSLRLKQLIEDLFEVSKITSNNITLEPVEVDVVELIKQAQVELSDRFDEAGIEFRFTVPKERVILTLDSQKTYRIFENLFVNVVKYAQPGTRAYMTVEKTDENVIICLKNISAQELNVSPNQLTERFVRGDESRHTEGSGLGLAIVKSIVEVQGGKFEIVIDGDLFKAIIVMKNK